MIGTMWNGKVLHVVETGTLVKDPSGRKPAISIDEQTVAIVGGSLYCTASTEAKIIAKIDAMNAWEKGEPIA
ncbi:hypothetical protein [Mesorhizobium sp. B263B2A]|uniref:hypothetical protein n=1 Tax=Mesorhizobium sp. B263B2A TaxID=2876669 RepID=UPI001CD0EAC4|nr:hypothetical protein [Mesorhizobium sp. B263B2A]MCA0032728.1 hypothetical protein [Mesorhizobium sp. B263B2A]